MKYFEKQIKKLNFFEKINYFNSNRNKLFSKINKDIKDFSKIENFFKYNYFRDKNFHSIKTYEWGFKDPKLKELIFKKIVKRKYEN